MAVFSVVAPSSSGRLGLMMEAASTSEKSVNFYQTTRRNNTGDSHLCTRLRENLKSHIRTFSIFKAEVRTEDGESMFLRDVGI
jgi:hypothetical protein